MITFLAVIGLVTLSALLWILHPLITGQSDASKPDRAHAATTSLALLVDDLRALDRDAVDGSIDPAVHARSRDELQRRILDEAGGRAEGDTPVREPTIARASRLAASLMLAVPIAGGLLYLHLGDLGALSPPAAGRNGAVRTEGHAADAAQIRPMVARLNERLQRDPADAEGWAMLARSALVLGDAAEAEQAQRRIVELRPKDAQAWADLADVAALARGRHFAGEPQVAIERALSLDPRHPKALALAASAAIERGDAAGALAHWERLLPMVSAGSEFERTVRSGIDRARQRLVATGTPSPAASTGGEIEGIVRVASSLADRLAPTDTVLVFARAVDGPRMPLAVLRRRADELPISFRLDDSMAMDRARPLSSAGRVVVTARITRSGAAEARAGDLEGASPPVVPGARDVLIEVSRAVE